MENFMKAYWLSFVITLGSMIILYFCWVVFPNGDVLATIIVFLFLFSVFVPVITAINTAIFVIIVLPLFAIAHKLRIFGFFASITLGIIVVLMQKLYLNSEIYNIYTLVFTGFGAFFGLLIFYYFRKFNKNESRG